MRYSRRATVVMAAAGSLLGVAVAPFGCGSAVSPGGPCDTKAEQVCSDNKEMSCGDDLKWKVAEDCEALGKTCVVNDEGDADCE